jgi:CheY-like chemotaxis protein
MSALLNLLSPEAAAAERAPRPARELLACRRRLRLLLVEDNLVNQRLAVRLLEKRGHTVVVASNGREALDVLARESFDVVLMDVQMPEMDGFEATSILRRKEQPTGRRTPVVAMTAHAMKGDRERCLGAGMDDYLSKPLQPEELFETVESLAEMGRATEPAPPPGSADGREPSPAEMPPRDRRSACEPPSSEFDLRKAMLQAGDDEQLLKEVIDIFLRDAPRSMQQMSEAVANGDAKRLERAAHTLKGSVGYFGAERTFRAAHRLEMLAKQGDLAAAGAGFAELKEALDRLEPELAAVLTQPSSVSR